MAESASTPGERVKSLREDLGLSARQLAGQAGISQGYLSKIESGQAMASSVILRKLAIPLGCNASQLAGIPRPSTGPAAAMLASLLHRMTRALIETAPGEPPESRKEPAPLAALVARAEQIHAARQDCRYAIALRPVPAVLLGLHEHGFGPARTLVLRTVAEVANSARIIYNHFGDESGAWMAAERVREAAQILSDPIYGGLAGASVRGIRRRVIRQGREAGCPGHRRPGGDGGPAGRADARCVAPRAGMGCVRGG